MKNNKLLFWSVTVGLAGFLFGFDTVVISGANQPTKELWDTSPLFHGTFIMSMALWGTVLGSLVGGYPTDKLGRKKTLFWIGILFLVSAIGSALAANPFIFSFFRFIGGIGVGASSVAAPTYIAEISSKDRRGRLVALYQFGIVLGIFVAFFSNYLLQGVGGAADWRYMLGAEAIPAALYCIMIFGVPNSPRWLAVKRNDKEGALAVLKQIYTDSEANKVLNDIVAETKAAAQKVSSGIFSKKYGIPLTLAFFISFFNQLSGINFLLYYAPEILEKAGLAAKESLGSSIWIGGTNLIFTIVGMLLIDKLGRKTLLIAGSIFYIIGLAGAAWAFYTGAAAGLLLAFIIIFIMAHAIGQGAVIWVFISEIFPNEVRAFGQSWGTGIHWVFAAIITLVTPLFLDAKKGIFGDNPWPIFAFFAFMMCLQLVWVLTSVPETKGISLEDLEKKLIR